MKLRTAMLIIALAFFSHAAKAQGGPPTGTAHNVVLTWVAPSPVGGSGTVLGYNIYRSLTTTGTFIKENPSLISGTTFTDTPVTAGTSYVFCATTVDSNGNESACGPTVTANVPTNPAPPTGLTATPHSGEYKNSKPLPNGGLTTGGLSLKVRVY